MSILPAKKYPNPTEINGKIHANLNRRRLSLSHLLLHVHSPFSAVSSRWQVVPTSPAMARSLLEAQLQTARHGQWRPSGNTDPEKNQNCRCSLLWSTPANESTQRLLQCRYNQASIYFHFHRTINLIYIALTTNRLWDMSKCMHDTHASSWRMLYVCTHLYLVPMSYCRYIFIAVPTPGLGQLWIKQLHLKAILNQHQPMQ